MLHIEKSAHFRIGLISKQLRDVQSVSIYNLFHKIDGRPLSYVELDQDMVIKSIPFLSRVTHLENVYFRGVTTKHSFTSLGALSMHQLIDSLSGHFDCGVLSHNLNIHGLSCPKKIARLNTEGEGDCNFCKRVCKNFPLERVYDIDLCLPIDDSKEIIESRHGGKEYLLTDTWFLRLLENTIVGGISEGIVVLNYHPEVLDEMKSFIESSQVNVSELKREDVHGAIMKGNNILYSTFLSEESFDHLKKIGLDISDDLLDPMVFGSKIYPDGQVM